MVHLSYSGRLKRLKLTSLEDRRQRGELIETYKIISGKENVKSIFFKSADSDLSSITGGNPQKWYKPKLKQRDFSKDHCFQYSCSVFLEQITGGSYSAKTVNSFKNRLDKHNSGRHGAQKALPICSPY